MIVLSVGMPRAGSGWHYNLVHDLMQTAGAVPATEIRQRYHLENVLTEVNSNIGVLSARRLGMVAIPALLGQTFVIKAHAAPTAASRLLQTLGLLKATYIYRDPRDAMLSAFDYGQRGLQRGRTNAFSHLTTFEHSLNFMLGYVHIWEQWIRQPHVFVTRYEDFQREYQTEVERLLIFLKLDRTASPVREVIEKYRPQEAEQQKGVHFNKGQMGRFRKIYSTAQQARLAEVLEPYLKRMGYEI